jgi:hypothetical protein
MTPHHYYYLFSSLNVSDGTIKLQSVVQDCKITIHMYVNVSKNCTLSKHNLGIYKTVLQRMLPATGFLGGLTIKLTRH